MLSPYQCLFCRRYWHSYGLLRKHVRLHRMKYSENKMCKLYKESKIFHHPRHVQDSQCDRTGTIRTQQLPDAIRRKTKRHTREETFTYVCKTCRKCFNYAEIGALKDHMKTFGLNCKLCFDRSTSRPNKLINNIPHSRVNQFRYGTCTERFDQLESTKAHVGTHTKEKPLHTNEKPYQYAQPNELQTQNLPRNGNMQFHCGTCNQSFDQIESLKVHIGTHTNEKPWHRQFNMKPYQCIRPKTKMHTPDMPQTGNIRYKCGTCNQRFDRLELLKAHIGVHTKEKPLALYTNVKPYQCLLSNELQTQDIPQTRNIKYQCGTCNQCFDRLELGAHTKEKPLALHTNVIVKPYQCLLSNELQTQDIPQNRIMQFRCGTCNKGFDQLESIKAQIGTHTEEKLLHTDEKPYQCAQPNGLQTQDKQQNRNIQFQSGPCNQRFDQFELSKAHIRTHTKEKPLHTKEKPLSETRSIKKSSPTKVKFYHCEVCKSRFTQLDTLDSHKKQSHKNLDKDEKFREMLQHCEKCQMPFFRWRTVKAHIGINPYQCKLCSKCCSDSHTLIASRTDENKQTQQKPDFENPHPCGTQEKPDFEKPHPCETLKKPDFEKPHPCETQKKSHPVKICKEDFSTASDLKDHIKSRPKWKQEKRVCPYMSCEQRFNSSDDLRRHIREHAFPLLF